MPDTQKIFSSGFFAGNRQRLREIVPHGPIIIAGNSLIQRSADSVYPFRQDSNFWYLTGLDEAGLILVIEESSEYIILPKISEYMEIFDGEIKKDELRKTSGVRRIFDNDSGWQELRKTLGGSKKVNTVVAPPDFIEELDMFTNPARARLQTLIKDVKPRVKFTDIKREIAGLRAIKQTEEIRAVKRATEITMKAFAAMSRRLPKLKNEYELEAVATGIFRSHNMRHAYEPIVAGGERANTLHYINNDQKIRANQLVLIDVGAEYSHYASDITRTIGINPTVRQKQLHGAVVEIHNYALDILHCGLSFKDYESQVREFIGQKLRELKLIRRVSKKVVRKYFPHAVTHPVGLDVHDPFPADGMIKPGMILTIEPGIYVEEEGIGIRTEDIVLVREKAIANLSQKLSHSLNSLRIS